MFGPETCLFLSIDDKARVPLGLTCANKQAPIIMHMEYKVRLPDHNFVVGERHKLQGVPKKTTPLENWPERNEKFISTLAVLDFESLYDL